MCISLLKICVYSTSLDLYIKENNSLINRRIERAELLIPRHPIHNTPALLKERYVEHQLNIIQDFGGINSLSSKVLSRLTNRQAVIPPLPSPKPTSNIQTNVANTIVSSNAPYETPIRGETLVPDGVQGAAQKRQTLMREFVTSSAIAELNHPVVSERIIVDLTMTPVSVREVLMDPAKSGSDNSYVFFSTPDNLQPYHLDLENMPSTSLLPKEKARAEQVVYISSEDKTSTHCAEEEDGYPVSHVYFPPNDVDSKDPYDGEEGYSSTKIWPKKVSIDPDEEQFNRQMEQAKKLSEQEAEGKFLLKNMPRVGSGLDHRTYQPTSTLVAPRRNAHRLFDDAEMARELQQSYDHRRNLSPFTSSSTFSSSSAQQEVVGGSILMAGTSHCVNDERGFKEPAVKMGPSATFGQGLDWRAVNPGTKSEHLYQELQSRRESHGGVLTLKIKRPVASAPDASLSSEPVTQIPKKRHQQKVATPPTPELLAGSRYKIMVVHTPEVLEAEQMKSHRKVLSMLDKNLREHPEWIDEEPQGRSYYLIQPEADNITYQDIQVVKTPGYGGYNGVSREVKTRGRELQVGACLLYHGRNTTADQRKNLLKSANRNEGSITDYLVGYLSPDGQKRITDAHPRHLAQHKWHEDCWPAAYINQASRKEHVNIVIDVCAPQIFQQMRKNVAWFDPDIPVCMVVTRTIPPRSVL